MFLFVGSKNKPKDVDEAEGSPKEGAEGGSVAKKPRKSASTPKYVFGMVYLVPKGARGQPSYSKS